MIAVMIIVSYHLAVSGVQSEAENEGRMKRLENAFGGGDGRMGGRRERLVMTIFKRNYFYVLDIGWGVGYCIIILIQ